MKRYRLLERAEIDGAVRERGYEFTLPDGVKGPCKCVQKTPDLHAASIDAVSGKSFTGRSAPVFEDVPLYEEVRDEKDAETLADRLNALEA